MVVSYSIIGTGAVGGALAAAFKRKGVEAAVASRRSPEVLAGAGMADLPLTAKPLAEALHADVVILAIPFQAHREVAGFREDWEGTVIVDATNAFGVPPEDLDDLPSSVVVARAFPGSKVVKAFNHLPAKVLAGDPAVGGGRRVVFLSGEDDQAIARVAALADQLGFAPVALGSLSGGGLLVQARGRTWAPLIFQDLVKLA